MTAGQLHIISTGKQSPEHLASILENIHALIDFIHLREKERTAKELYEIIALLAAKGVPLTKIIVNDRMDAAILGNARGIQLAYHSLPLARVRTHMPDMLLGSSVHSVHEAKIAEQQGADFVLFGHVYATHSKPGAAPRGLDGLAAVSGAVKVPVIAIGGITPDNASEVMDSGAQGIAVMSGILQAEDPVYAARRYRAAISG